MGLIRDIRDDGLGGLQHNAITAKIEDLVNWSRSRSSWPASFGASAWRCSGHRRGRPTS
jgi:NADH-quinone oxidoreductase subunit B